MTKQNKEVGLLFHLKKKQVYVKQTTTALFLEGGIKKFVKSFLVVLQ